MMMIMMMMMIIIIITRDSSNNKNKPAIHKQACAAGYMIKGIARLTHCC
jgi:hypothetical protein